MANKKLVICKRAGSQPGCSTCEHSTPHKPITGNDFHGGCEGLCPVDYESANCIGVKK